MKILGLQMIAKFSRLRRSQSDRRGKEEVVTRSSIGEKRGLKGQPDGINDIEQMTANTPVELKRNKALIGTQ